MHDVSWADILVPIGDMHVHKNDIPEATKLIRWIVDGIKVINSQSHGRRAVPVFMGDQYNDFGVKNIAVEEFWKWAYALILAELGYPAISLTGNHDMTQDETSSSMTVHDSDCVIVRRDPLIVTNGTAFIGFIRKEDLFNQIVADLYAKGIRQIFCHAEFNGCQYENGFYAPHGLDVTKYPKDLKFYSGHIHLKQHFGNIFYFGTPRHLTRSDIGEVKGVHIVDLVSGQIMFQPTPVEVWSPFMEIKVVEGQDEKTQLAEVERLTKTLNSPSKLYVTVTGTKDFVKKIGNKLPDGIKQRSEYTDETRKVEIKESEGIPATFMKFSTGFFKTSDVPADVQSEVLNKIYEACPSLKIGTT